MDDQFDQAGGEDMDLDDEMLLAIALSMEQDQPGEPNSNQGQAAAAAGPAAPEAPSDAAVQAAQLQQALMQLIQQHNAHGAGQGAQQQQQAAQPPPEPSRPKAPKPSWVEPASKFPAASPVPEDLVISPDLLQPQSPLDVPFSAAMGVSLAAAVQRSPLKAANTMTWDWAKAAAERISVDGNAVLALQQSWQKLAPSSVSQTTDVLSSVLSMLRHAVALRAMRTLEEDEDDLFFEGGSSMVAFHEALRNGHILPTFLDAMMSVPNAGGTERNKTVKFWTDLIKTVFKKVESLSLSDPASFEPILRALDVLTQSDMVREVTASLLVGDADFAARYALRSRGKEFEDMSFIAPLLGFSALPVLDFHKASLVDFPAKKCFEDLRGYPRNRGSHVDSEINSIRANMQRIYTAAHEILKRVATIKTLGDGVVNKGGKEVIGAWLAGVSAVNVSRSDAGSYLDEVLRHKSVRKSSSDAFLLSTTARVHARHC